MRQPFWHLAAYLGLLAFGSVTINAMEPVTEITEPALAPAQAGPASGIVEEASQPSSNKPPRPHHRGHRRTNAVDIGRHARPQNAAHRAQPATTEKVGANKPPRSPHHRTARGSHVLPTKDLKDKETSANDSSEEEVRGNKPPRSPHSRAGRGSHAKRTKDLEKEKEPSHTQEIL